MDAEIQQLQKLKTYQLTSCLLDQTAIVNKWVFYIKWDDAGNITRYKAHLIAKGFSHIPGIDYDETFAPVVQIETI